MNRVHTFLICCTLSCLFGCATAADMSKVNAAPATAPAAPVPTSTLADRLTADLNAAIADAQAATDPFAPLRLTCWKWGLSQVPTLPTLSSASLPAQPAGVFSAYEVAAEKAEAVDALISEVTTPSTALRVAFATNCGPVGLAFQDFLLRFQMRLVNVGGVLALLPK